MEEIQHLIERVDQVCRESEAVRMHAERSMRRRDFWPDYRQPASQEIGAPTRPGASPTILQKIPTGPSNRRATITPAIRVARSPSALNEVRTPRFIAVQRADR